MKTQKSRNSRQPAKDYSSVCHQQGRMLTDSDLTEQALISRDRLNQALRDVIGSGTPRHDALLQQEKDGTLSLHWGRVYIDGIPAEVRAAENASDADLFNYTQQLYYPQPPDLPAAPYRYYVDCWERTITWLDDAMLRDPGLQGADTTTRTQTLAQVKYCATGTDPLCADINPSIGDARLHLELRNLSMLTDPCDPCADELDLNAPVGNYLFRVEVHDVEYNLNNQPVAVVLKWSSENAAEAYKTVEVPPDFSSNQFVYEFFDEVSETRQGIHLARDINTQKRLIDGSRPALQNTFSASSAAAREFVRRWDGWCRIEKTANNWILTAGFEGSIDLTAGAAADTPGHITQGGAEVTVELRVITMSIELSNHAMLAGDYWTTAVREAVHLQNEVLLEDPATHKGAPPEGEVHHYMLLGDINSSAKLIPVSGTGCDPYDACQLAQFPSLTDLNTSDICHTTPECNSTPSLLSLLSAADPSLSNQQRIHLSTLINSLLCNTTAATVPLTAEPLCELLQEEGAQTVQDALNILCTFDHDGCASYSISAGPGWQQVFEKIASGGDAHICFHEGTYQTEETIQVKQKGHLKITCAGEATRFIHPHNEAVIRFQNCHSVSIQDGLFIGGKSGEGSPQDQTFRHVNGALTFDNCGEVNLQHVVLRCNQGTRLFASCLTVASTLEKTGHVRIRECRFEVGHQQVGALLLNQQRISVDDNLIVARKKPKSMGLDSMLKDHIIAARVKDLMIRGAVIRNFDKLDPALRKELQNIQTDAQAGSRQIMFQSPIAANHWKKALAAAYPNRVYKSNKELLDTLKEVATTLILDKKAVTKKSRAPRALQKQSPITRWLNDLEKQNPAVMSNGIVCAGSQAREIRVLNNTISGAYLGIQVGVSDRSRDQAETLFAGITRIQGNSIHLLLSPLASRRRGGIFAGNCSQLTITDNSVQVQRFNSTSSTRIESLRVFGYLGRKMIAKDNYSANCNVGIHVKPLGFNTENSYQWLVADNMFEKASIDVEAPDIVQRSNNKT